MGIIRGGDAEYDEFEPSYKEKAEKLEKILELMLEQDSKSIKLSGKYIATDEIKIIGINIWSHLSSIFKPGST